MNILELVKFVQAKGKTEEEQANMLAQMADPPEENFNPKIPLPVQNEIPAYKIGDGGIGSVLSNQNYGVPAPVPGQPLPQNKSVGELLIGE